MWKIELLLGCDANSHHEVWGSTDITSRSEGQLDFFTGTKVHILNRGTKLTFLDSKSNSITICTQGETNLARDWRVPSEPSG